MHKDRLWWVRTGIIAVGLLLWLINWWAARPLFLDEANVVRNLFDRGVGGFFSPLDHRQYAPPLYLVLAKGCGELFGYAERSLRLPALLGGALTIVALVDAGRSLKLRWWGLLPLVMLFANPAVLRYATEVKPYALDMGVAAALLAWNLRRPPPDWRLALGGALAVWCSLPAVFVLAAIGASRLLSPLLRPSPAPRVRALMPWLGVGTVWLLSFALLYMLVLRPALGSKYLANYHSGYFFPLPGSEDFAPRALGLLTEIPKLAFGFTTFAIVIGCAVYLLGATRREYAWLLLPALLVVFTSAAGHYSLLPRLLLFTLPGAWLVAGVVSQRLMNRLPGRLSWLSVVPWVLIAGGTNVLRHFHSPLTFSDSRRLVLEVSDEYTPILHHAAVPAYDYYHRIHPHGDVSFLPVPERIFREVSEAGNYALLYEGLTQGNIRGSLQRDSIRAAERGCEVRSVAYFRARTLYVSCPAGASLPPEQ